MTIELVSCPACGTRNGPDRTVCLSCSASLAAAPEAKEADLAMPTKGAEVEELEKKPWFRFLKLCYIFVYILAVAFVSLMAYEDLPRDYLDDYNSRIVCNNGHSWGTQANRIYPINGKLDDDEDAKAKKLCSYAQKLAELPGPNPFDRFDKLTETPKGKIVPAEDLPDNLSPKGKIDFIPDEKHYRLVTETKTRGSYNEVAGDLVWGLGIILLLGELVRRSFLYVVIGRSFFHTFSGDKAVLRWLHVQQGLSIYLIFGGTYSAIRFIWEWQRDWRTSEIIGQLTAIAVCLLFVTAGYFWLQRVLKKKKTFRAT